MLTDAAARSAIGAVLHHAVNAEEIRKNQQRAEDRKIICLVSERKIPSCAPIEVKKFELTAGYRSGM